MPYLRDVLTASVAHPLWSVFVLLAAYSITMITIAHLSALRNRSEREVRSLASHPPPSPGIVRRLPTSHDAGLLDSLEIPSPDGLGIHVWSIHQPATGDAGLLMSVINDGTEPLKSRKVRLARARSFDSKRKTFIDDLQAHVLLPAFGDVPHNEESEAEWLILINHDKGQLEIGGKRGGVPLRWPPREPIQTKQVWLLTVAVEAERVALHEFHFRMEWTRPDTIKVRKP